MYIFTVLNGNCQKFFIQNKSRAKNEKKEDI